MSDPKPSNPGQPAGGATPGAAKRHSPVVRIIEWVVIGALGLVVANEAYSKFSYDATLAELEKAIDAAQSTGDDLASDEVGPLISGMPSRKEVVDGRKTLIDYQWRSLFKTYRIVIHTGPSPENEMVVLKFETDAPPEEPQPAAVTGDGNSEPPSGMMPSGMMPGGMMPGGGTPGGSPGAQGGGPGPMGGAGRPELESEGDDQSEDSDGVADEPDNDAGESDEALEETEEESHESDETTDETETAPEEAGESAEGTDEATDPSE